MSTVKAERVKKAKGTDEMLDMLIGQLHSLSSRAENLANALEHGKYEPRRRLDRKERELAELTVNSHMGAVLDEMKFHATQDNQDEVVGGFEYITDLMAFKRQL